MKTLNGWKEIAAYLRTSVRTVQRWERTEGIPVLRHQHQRRGTVYALTPQLDEWLRRRNLEVTERIRGELGRTISELSKLMKRQNALTDELRQAIASGREIWKHVERQRKGGGA